MLKFVASDMFKFVVSDMLKFVGQRSDVLDYRQRRTRTADVFRLSIDSNAQFRGKCADLLQNLYSRSLRPLLHESAGALFFCDLLCCIAGKFLGVPVLAVRACDVRHVFSVNNHICKASASKNPPNRRACLRALRRVRCNASTDANRPRYLPAQSCPIGLKRSRSRFDGGLGCALLAVDPSPFGVRVGISMPVTSSLFTLTSTEVCAYLILRSARRDAAVDRFQVPLAIGEHSHGYKFRHDRIMQSLTGCGLGCVPGCGPGCGQGYGPGCGPDCGLGCGPGCGLGCGPGCGPGCGLGCGP